MLQLKIPLSGTQHFNLSGQSLLITPSIHWNIHCEIDDYEKERKRVPEKQQQHYTKVALPASLFIRKIASFVPGTGNNVGFESEEEKNAKLIG